MPSSLIISLAYLKVNCDSNRNGYLDNFVPLIVECLRESQSDIISVLDLQTRLKEKFGITIPQQVINRLLERAKKKGYVFLEDRVYYRNLKNLTNLTFRNCQAEVQRVYTALIEDFISFNLKKYNRQIDATKAETILLSFINYNQVNIISNDPDLQIFPDLPQLAYDDKVIVSDYITTAQISKPEVYAYIETIVKGYMIVNALYLPVENYTNKKFRKTKIFFDTPFMIYALGYSGEEMKSPCSELLDLLYANGAQLFCFKHNVNEIAGILYACIPQLGHFSETPFGRTVQYFTSRGYTPSDIKLLISQLDSKIELLRIHIVEEPNFNEHRFVIDEKGLSELLKSKYAFPRDEPISKDVDSISSIYRLRKGQDSISIDESKAIFVTTNKTLVKAVNEFYYSDHDSSLTPPCVSDFMLTNYIWLKTPTLAPNLPMKRIVADCYASIQPDDKLMGKWVDEIEKLSAKGGILEDDYFFMRYSDEARRAIVEHSLGDYEAITEGTIPEILSRAKKMIVEESEQRLRRVQEELDDVTKQRKEIEGKVIHLHEIQTASDNKRLERVKGRANKLAKIIVSIIRVISIAIIGVGLLLSLPIAQLRLSGFSEKVIMQPRFILAGVLLVFLIFSFYNVYYGVSIKAELNNLEVKISNKFYQFLLSLTE